MHIPETTVIAVSAMVDEFQATHWPPVRRRGGQQPAPTRSEVLPLALLGQLGCFGSERAWYRVVDSAWRHLFPRLPSRVQLNANIRAQAQTLVAFGRCCARQLDALPAESEVLDCTAVPLRTAKRRGVGAMPAVVAPGKSGRLGWFVGVRLLVATTPTGAVTGWGIAPGNEQDRSLADILLAERAAPEPALPSVGRPASGGSLAAAGFAGRAARARWPALGADVLAPPQRGSGERWDKPVRAQHRTKRQVVETVLARLHGAFRLARGRPRSLGGLLARIAAKIALSHALIRLNRDADRPGLTLAEVVM